MAPPSPMPPPSPSYPAYPAAPPPSRAADEAGRQIAPWGVAVLVGGLAMLAASVLVFTETLEDASAKEVTSLLLAVFGQAVMGLGLILAGCVANKASVGARVALLGVGAYILSVGSPLSFLRFFGFGGF